ncbi:MAG: DUF58 domain-containing protein [Desulfobulbaceae bacterium]|nr:DUF58 domain-containing protein [Desulfobulbaceae bacterium]
MKNRAVSIPAALLTRFSRRDRAALPVELRGRRIYVFPTREGFIFFVMLFSLLIGSVNHNNNLGFILTFLLGGISFVSIFHTYRNISGITLSAVRAKPVFAGQQAAFEITVAVPPRSFRQQLSFYFHDRQRTTLDLPPNSRRTVRIFHNTEKRGLLTPGMLRVSTTYPLGLFRSWSCLLPDASCLVYPRPLPGPFITDPALADEEYDEGETGGAGVDDFSGLETYQRGDSLQHISWKTYSRGQGLYTKKFEGSQGKTVYFNPDLLPGKDPEQKFSRICSMILTAETIRMPYGLKLGNHVTAPGLGGSHKRKCLRELALAGAEE